MGLFGGGSSSILIRIGRSWVRCEGLSEGIQDVCLDLGLDLGRRRCAGGKVVLLVRGGFASGVSARPLDG